MKLNGDHINHVLIAFIATLAVYAAVVITAVVTDSEAIGENVLRDVLLALAGVIGGVAVGKAQAAK